MVSRRNLFTMIILLLIMIFMFMFSSVIKQEFNEYGINSYVEDTQTVERLKQTYEERKALLAQKAHGLDDRIDEAILSGEKQDKRTIFLSRNKDTEVAKVVATWCEYSKRPLISYSTLQGLEKLDASKFPEVIIVDGENVNWDGDTASLCALADKGVCVIFVRMPLPKELKNNESLCKLTGIQEIYSENIAIDGIWLFPGFFVGNEEQYKDGPNSEDRMDLDLKIPWYVVGEGSKTYIMGMVDDRSQKNENLPSIVWRHAYGTGKVFCINGDYVSDETGIGYLTACLADKDSYDVYPIINAQNMVFANYGGFTDENGDLLEAIYDQRQVDMFRDVVWPNMVSMTERTSNKISMMASFQLDYEDNLLPVADQLVYYLRLLKEGAGEAGISTKQFSSLSLAQKLRLDLLYWQAEAGNYALQAAYLDDVGKYGELKESLRDLRTIIVDKSEGNPVSYLDDGVTCQMATSNGLIHTFTDDMNLKSIQTALGYSNIVLDMSLVSHPSDMDFAEFSRDFTSNVLTFWRQFEGFAKTTVSESDLRIRRYLALDYDDERIGNEIHLHVDGFDEEAFFILKLNRDELDKVTGAEIKDLKNGFYLLEVSQEDVVITVKERRLSIY